MSWKGLMIIIRLQSTRDILGVLLARRFNITAVIFLVKDFLGVLLALLGGIGVVQVSLVAT